MTTDLPTPRIRTPEQLALLRAIDAARGPLALARALTARGHHVNNGTTVSQWMKARVPAAYCPDIELLTGVRCEELRPDVHWGVLRGTDPVATPAPTTLPGPTAA